MSEKLRNENLGESQREEMVQRDVQSPSASKFDDKKEFFENVSTQKENVSNEEILTEQKKEICEDLKSIGQNQKEGKTFDDKKEFFEIITSEQPQDTLSQSQNNPESQKELLPKEEWRNKYEGERKSPIDNPLKQEEGKERLSQQKEECRNENEKEKSFGRDEKDVPSQSGVSSMMQGQQGKESSLGTESPMKQMKEEKESPFQQKEEVWKNKNENEKSFGRDEKDVPSQSGVSSMVQGQQGKEGKEKTESPMKQMKEEKESPFQQKEECRNENENEKEKSFGRDEKDVPSQSGVSSMMQGQQGQQGKEITKSPMKQMKEEGKESPFQQKEEVWKNKNENEKEKSFGRDDKNIPSQSGVSSMMQGQQGQQSSFGNESPMKQMKEEGKESPFQQKGEDWKNKNENEFERNESPFSQYTSQLGSSPMTQGQQGQESSFGSGVPSMLQGQQGNEGSFRTGSPMSQGKDTSYGSLAPNEKSSSLQGDLMNFGQQNEWEKQRSFPQEQNLSFQSGDTSMLKSTGNQQFLGSEYETPKDKSDYHPHPRIKGFEPKDPLQSKKEFETENKDNK